MEDKLIDLILVESHPIIREGLRNALLATQLYNIVAEAEDGDSAVFACEKHRHDIVVMNSMLPGSDSFGIISSIKKRHQSKVLVSYIAEDMTVIQELRKCGVDGFVGKEASSSEYNAAINAISAGGLYFSQNLANVVFKVSQATNDTQNEYGLTGRELEILSLLSSGYCNKEVANQYNLSVRTVEAHRLNIRRKTSSNTLSDLVRISRSLGLANMAGHLDSISARGALN